LSGVSWCKMPSILSANLTKHVGVDVQTDVGHVVKMLAGDQPDDLTDLTFGVMARQASKSIRVNLFILCELCRIIECRPFWVVKRELVRYCSSASNLASFTDALIATDRPISMQKRQMLVRATCSRMSRTVSGNSSSFLSSLPIFA